MLPTGMFTCTKSKLPAVGLGDAGGLMAEGLAPSRIDAALMAALQALTDVQDDPDAGRELRERVDLVKRELVQLLEDRRRRSGGSLN